ncbi:MAG: amidohydrolase family protein [Rhodospirillales bacterium]
MRFLSLLLAVVFFVTPGVAETQLPIFDAHLHYSRSAWDVFPPDAVIAKLKAAGVSGALASSSPDEGTQKLLRAAPKVIVGGYRPYKVSADIGFWYKKQKLIPAAEKILAQGRHRVFGEVHINTPESLDDPGMVRYIRLARDKGLYLHVHSQADVVDGLYQRWPDLKVLWAHAGFSEPPAVVDRLLGLHKTLWTEVSYRAAQIMPGDVVDANWRKVFIAHPDRFLIGSDTWTVERLEEYTGLIGQHRAWLMELPKGVREKIAHQNARRLFGLVR